MDEGERDGGRARKPGRDGGIIGGCERREGGTEG